MVAHNIFSSHNAFLSRLWRLLRYRRKVQLCVLLILLVFVSFFELISIGAIAPFLIVMSSPEKVLTNEYSKMIMMYLPAIEADQIPLMLTLFFIALVLLSAIFRSILNWAQLRISYGIGIDFGVESYRRSLYQPYQTQVNRNSSGVILAITQYTRLITGGVIVPLLMSISSCFLLISILSVLLFVDIKLTFLMGISLGIIYILLSLIIKNRLTYIGQLGSQNDKKIAQTLQESFGGIRDVLIDGTQELFTDIYRRRHIRMAELDVSYTTLSTFPRYGIEALAISIFAGAALFMADESGGFVNAIPALGAIALGAQRILPILQQLFASWSSLKTNLPRLLETLNLMEQPLPVSMVANRIGKDISFKHVINFENLSFHYENSEKGILKTINYSIKRGGRIGVVGKTGSGKSTFVDLLMGLITPTGGTLSVDAADITPANCRIWQKHIAHVPQSIFLADATIKENIAFGVMAAEVDLERVLLAAQMAQLSETIIDLPQGIDTVVGERGVRLSGGQRQRIGIARALYKKADVIIFDEATSALDETTERAVMDSIRTLPVDITLIIVAHRTSTLAACDEIIELEGGQIVRVGSYASLYGNDDS
jgi:ABC-type bacteriocin/lantibiotic exporter with double-glycine peptidase domain